MGAMELEKKETYSHPGDCLPTKDFVCLIWILGLHDDVGEQARREGDDGWQAIN